VHEIEDHDVELVLVEQAAHGGHGRPCAVGRDVDRDRPAQIDGARPP
jgi:hypothetical protein